MNSSGLLPSLSLFTLLAVLIIAVVGYLWFMRKRSNRHPLGDNQGFDSLKRTSSEPADRV